MMLTADDFPLRAVAHLIYSPLHADPVLVAISPFVATQVATALNLQASSEARITTPADWLKIH